MINYDFKDILPVPDLEDMSQSVEDDLKNNDSKITNFRNGGVFKTLLMIFLKAITLLYGLLQEVIPQVFLKKAKGIWLDYKAAENGITRKAAQKTEGAIIAYRNESDGQPIVIPEGTIIRTGIDISGNELRYITLDKAILDIDVLRVSIPIRAELAGAAYNVPANMIKYPLQHIPGLDGFVNEENWITTEGTDEEEDEVLRDRCINSWDEFATQTTAPSYVSKLSKIEGVLVVNVDDMHPRGQGSIDIIITGSAGMPTEALLQKVRDEVEEIKSPYDDVMVYAPQPVYLDVNATLYLNKYYGDVQETQDKALGIISSLFAVSKDNQGNYFYKAKLISKLMVIDHVTNVKITSPTEDLTVDVKQLIMPGTINVIVEREGG